MTSKASKLCIQREVSKIDGWPDTVELCAKCRKWRGSLFFHISLRSNRYFMTNPVGANRTCFQILKLGASFTFLRIFRNHMGAETEDHHFHWWLCIESSFPKCHLWSESTHFFAISIEMAFTFLECVNRALYAFYCRPNKKDFLTLIWWKLFFLGEDMKDPLLQQIMAHFSWHHVALVWHIMRFNPFCS